MRLLSLGLVTTILGCGASQPAPASQDKALQLVLKAVGAAAQDAHPNDSVSLKVIAVETSGTNIQSAADLHVAVGQAIGWSILGTPASDVQLSQRASATGTDGVATVALDVGHAATTLQIQAVSSGADPITFTVQVKPDVQQLELLNGSSITSTTSKTEALRVRVVRPGVGGALPTPVSGVAIHAALVGGAANGAQLENSDDVSDSGGVATVRFDTGTVANLTYQIQFCGQGSCGTIPTASLSVLVKQRVDNGGACQYFTDCADGYVCSSGTCLPAAAYCARDSDCPTGYHCSDTTRQCELGSGGPPCSSNSNCSNGDICGTAGQCIPPGGCTSSASCPSGWQCDTATGACLPPDGTPPLDVRGTWSTHYHFDISHTFNSTVTGLLGPIIDFLNLVFAGQLQIDVPVIGDILEQIINRVVSEYVPPWVVELTTMLGDFIHLFENVEAQGTMHLVQSPVTPVLGTVVGGDEAWTSAQLYIASLCPGGPAAFAADPSCGRLDVAVTPTFNLGYSNNNPTVGVKVDDFAGEVLGDQLVLHNRVASIELRQLVNVALDVIVAFLSHGDYYEFETFLTDSIPCSDIQDEFDNLACDITGGDVCEIDGIEAACESAATSAVNALTNMLGQIPITLELDFEARASIHDLTHDGVADVLGSPTTPADNTESALTGSDQTITVFGGPLDDSSWWYGQKQP